MHAPTSLVASTLYTHKATLDRDEPAAFERPIELQALGERVRALRARKGISRRALSRVAGVSERHLANLELGEGNISFLVLLQIAEALQTSLAELVGDFTTATPEWLQIRALLEGRDATTLRRLLVLMMEALDAVTAAGPSEQHHRIALIGLRGAGKSTLGARLAEDLGFSFVELSRKIEQFAGCSIAEIYALYGANAYRRHERRALEESIRTDSQAVIAMPGGVVSEPSTMTLLLTHCTTVWLQARPEEHMQRVIAQGDMRPMAGNREAMQDLTEILDARKPYYAQAPYQVDTSDVSVERAFNRLRSLVQQVLPSECTEKMNYNA